MDNIFLKYRDRLLFSAGLILSLTAIIWWYCRYQHHPPALLVSTDGYGGCPSVCYLPPRRSSACILLPGSSYSALTMRRSFQHTGENRIRILFCPVVSEQLRGMKQFYGNIPLGHIVLLPGTRKYSSGRQWLKRAQYDGIFIQTAPRPVLGWKITQGQTEYKEPFWNLQNRRYAFHLCRSRSGALDILVKQQDRIIIQQEIPRSDRQEIHLFRLPE